MSFLLSLKKVSFSRSIQIRFPWSFKFHIIFSLQLKRISFYIFHILWTFKRRFYAIFKHNFLHSLFLLINFESVTYYLRYVACEHIHLKTSHYQSVWYNHYYYLLSYQNFGSSPLCNSVVVHPEIKLFLNTYSISLK